jgi:hypothetical protein
MESAMVRSILAAGSIVLAMAVSPAVAQQQQQQQQQSPAPDQPGAELVDPSLVGQVVYSSDGQKLGEIAEVGMAGGTPAVRVEMGEFLGMGASSVIINAKALTRKADRVEVAMTADEIKETISKQRKKQP